MTKKLPRFGTAIVDPPWPYARTSKSKGVTPSNAKLTGYSDSQYEPMTISDLTALPVGDVVSNVLILWTTAPMIPTAVELVKAWGFEYITQMFWVKSSNEPQWDDKKHVSFIPSYGVGYWFRGNCEPIVIAKKKGSPSHRTNLDSTIFQRRLGHSQKPDTMHEIAEAHYPGPYLELFARRRRKGWSQLGDELPGDERDIRESLPRMARRRA
jgi:N6-adenosine-specific RNA methylase IME4